MPRDTAFLEPAVHPHAAEIAILDEMARLLARPEQWCQEQTGCRVFPFFWHVRRCLIGALITVDGGPKVPRASMFLKGHRSPAKTAVEDRLDHLAYSLCRKSAAGFNDLKKTQHSDILALIARARASFETAA